MKKVTVLLVAILALTFTQTAFAGGLLPSADILFKVEMPSMSAVVRHSADEVKEDETGSVIYIYNNINHEAFDLFSQRLSDAGCELASYSVTYSILSAVVTKGYGEMFIEYDNSSYICKIIYKAGTYPEKVVYSVGEIVVYGRYEQDDDLTNGVEPIEWIVLDKNEQGAYLLISKYALDTVQYNEIKTSITWEESTIRNWLNNEFYGAAFNEKEQAEIVTTHVIAEKNPSYDTDPGNDTNDRVFLLSVREAKKLFKNNSGRACYPSEYALIKGAYAFNTCYWWLRSPGEGQDCAALVICNGAIRESGYGVGYHDSCVRPVMWVNLN